VAECMSKKDVLLWNVQLVALIASVVCSSASYPFSVNECAV
jgi:hypothetical protein